MMEAKKHDMLISGKTGQNSIGISDNSFSSSKQQLKSIKSLEK